MQPLPSATALRRLAAKQGLRLVKSRARNPRHVSYGGFAIVDAASHVIEHGREFDLSIAEVAAFLKGGDQ